MRESIKERNERVFEECKNSGNYILDGSKNGNWRMINKNNSEGKAILKAQKKRQEIAEKRVQDREDAVEIIVEMFEEENVTKIQIREELNKLGAFSVENLNKISKELGI